jgi:hypothetical protein
MGILADPNQVVIRVPIAKQHILSQDLYIWLPMRFAAPRRNHKGGCFENFINLIYP